VISSNRQLKEAKVAEIKEKLQKSQGLVLSEYQGLNVEDDTQLRKNLREAGVEYKVYKNTLVVLAARELGIEGIVKHLQGPISIAFGYEEPTVAARVLNDFAKTHKKLQLKAGIIQGVVMDGAQVNELASIPPRDVLIARLLGSFKAPLSNFAYLLNSIKEQKESAE
jgi:large subunit ribosomal protein L10